LAGVWGDECSECSSVTKVLREEPRLPSLEVLRRAKLEGYFGADEDDAQPTLLLPRFPDGRLQMPRSMPARIRTPVEIVLEQPPVLASRSD
jgi:hypothetical protein